MVTELQRIAAFGRRAVALRPNPIKGCLLTHPAPHMDHDPNVLRDAKALETMLWDNPRPPLRVVTAPLSAGSPWNEGERRAPRLAFRSL